MTADHHRRNMTLKLPLLGPINLRATGMGLGVTLAAAVRKVIEC